MKDFNRQSATPVKYPRSRRNHPVALISSFRPGKSVPLAAIPLLREDGFNGSFEITLEMRETKKIILNPVTARVTAWVVPWLAHPRFEGSYDQFDRSYKGLAQVDGGDVVNFFAQHSPFSGGSLTPFYKTLGLHARSGASVNSMYLQAYNLIYNYRLKNRSPKLFETEQVTSLHNGALRPAFWTHSRFGHIVPDWDQAAAEGEVTLNFVRENLPDILHVKSDSVTSADGASSSSLEYRHEGHPDGPGFQSIPGNLGLAGTGKSFATIGGKANLSALYTALQEEGFRLSLANLALAKKTQAFADLRRQYTGIDEDHVLDLLMSGIRIPDQALKNPILLADQTVRFGQALRYSTTAGDMDDSATSGSAKLALNVRCPVLNTGGTIIVMVEVLPEQLWERQADPMLGLFSTEDLPDALSDYLDPERVEVVKNSDIDVTHESPDDTFGYAPLNWQWNAFGPRAGGKYLRPEADTLLDDDRMKVWAVEGKNPTLGASFFICKDMHIKPFIDQTTDPFEVFVKGAGVIDGLTQFGGALIEAEDNYSAVMEKVDTTRIVKDEE